MNISGTNVYVVPGAIRFKGWQDLARVEKDATSSKKMTRRIKESGRNPKVLEKHVTWVVGSVFFCCCFFVLRDGVSSSLRIVFVVVCIFW